MSSLTNPLLSAIRRIDKAGSDQRAYRDRHRWSHAGALEFCLHWNGVSMVSEMLFHLRSWLPVLLVVAFAGSGASGQDDSQRPLPLPEQAAADPGVHLELLKRLRSTITQQTQADRDASSEQQPQSPTRNPQTDSTPRSPGGRTPDIPGSRLNPAPADSPAQPQQPESPDSSTASGLRQLGDLINQWKDRLPENMLPPGLDQLTPQQIQKAAQAPEAQQKLRELLQQFQRDGMLPPPAEDGATPAPLPPTATKPDLPRSSLKALDNFLRKLQEKATAPEPSSQAPGAVPGMPAEPEETGGANNQQPLKENVASDDSAPTRPGAGSPPRAGRSIRRRDRQSATPPATQNTPQTDRPAVPGPSTETPGAMNPETANPETGNPPASNPESGTRGQTSNETEPNAVDAPSSRQPRNPAAPAPDKTPAPDVSSTSPATPRNPAGPPTSRGTDAPQGSAPAAGVKENQPLDADSQATEPRSVRPQAESESAGGPTTPTAPRSPIESLQRLFRDLAQPGTERPPVNEATPTPESLSGTREPNADVNQRVPGTSKRSTPPSASGRSNQSSGNAQGGRADTTAEPRSLGDNVPGQSPEADSSAAPFSVENFLREQLQDPDLRSAAESPEMQRAIQQMLQQGAGALGESTPQASGGAGDRRNGPPDPNASPRSDHRAPRPQDSRAGVPVKPESVEPGQDPSATAPRSMPAPDAENSAGNAAGNAAEGGAQRDEQAERVQQQLQQKGFGATLRQLVDEARRDVQQQQEQQDELESARNAASENSASKELPPSTPPAGPVPQGGPTPPSGLSQGGNNPGMNNSDKPFDPRALLEMLDRLGDPPRATTPNGEAGSAEEQSNRGPGDLQLPENLNFPERNVPLTEKPSVGPGALDRMRQLADRLISGEKSPGASSTGPAASGATPAAASSPANLQFDWTPALILAGLLITAAAVLLIARWSLRRTDAGVQNMEKELLQTTQTITTQADVIRAFHQLARRCSRAVRPWWNHQQLATELTRVLPDRQQTVTELAAVYERARYQPRDQALTPDEVAAARGAIRSCVAATG